ncbi:hypothetical protein AX14_002632 [Amanita brunnescens Koide BX004]|nr:hypothetical protein AX14_002632 [Amanita brunnescens Koide BX004]
MSQQQPAASDTIKKVEDKDTTDLEKYKENLRSTLKDAKRVRMSVLRRIQESPGNEQVFLDNVVIYSNIDRIICDIRKDLDDVDLELLKDGHYDIVTWSKAMRDRTMNLCTATSGVSGIGAGFTYTTIFSATRGSIALMSWAFIFFLAGFLIPTLAQVLFSWTATMSPGIRFRYPQRIFNKLGEFLGIAILGGVLSTVAAIFLILLSLYGIRYSPIISGAAPGTFFTNSVRSEQCFSAALRDLNARQVSMSRLKCVDNVVRAIAVKIPDLGVFLMQFHSTMVTRDSRFVRRLPALLL